MLLWLDYAKYAISFEFSSTSFRRNEYISIFQICYENLVGLEFRLQSDQTKHVCVCLVMYEFVRDLYTTRICICFRASPNYCPHPQTNK